MAWIWRYIMCNIRNFAMASLILLKNVGHFSEMKILVDFIMDFVSIFFAMLDIKLVLH